MKDDLISKTAAIDAVEGISWYHQNKNGEMVQGANSAEHQAWYKADDIYHALYTLPSAQPGCEDAVSRFEVLRLIDYSSHDLNDAVDNRYMQNEIKQLPSVTPKQPGWIPVTKRLPEEEGLYLVAGDFPPGAEVHTRYFNVMYDRSVWSGTMTDKVKWWMPIPNPPEGGQK